MACCLTPLPTYAGNMPFEEFKKLVEGVLRKWGSNDVYRRRCFAHCYAYAQAYRDGKTGKDAEKQVRSHRRPKKGPA
jgi:hypothetical protein